MKIYYLSTTSFADCDMNLLHHLSLDHSITYGVIVPNKNANYTTAELSDYAKNNNINFKSFYIKYRFRDLRNIEAYLTIIRSIIDKEYEAIYINNFDQLYLNILLALFLDKKITVIGLHDVVMHSGTPAGSLAQFSKRVLISKFNNLLTFSISQSNILRSQWSRKLIYTIPLALKDFGPSTKRNSNNKVNFLFFGNIKSYKGLDTLLRSIRRLSAKYNSFTLTIAGRCSDWNETYQPLLNGITNIKTHIRFIDNNEISYFFSNADYLILPYKDATQSGPLMIAYNYSVPVIASNINGFKEFVKDSSTGYLFNVEDESDLDRVLEEAIVRDKKTYAELVTQLKGYANESFSTSSIANKYDHLFNNLTLKVS